MSDREIPGVRRPAVSPIGDRPSPRRRASRAPTVQPGPSTDDPMATPYTPRRRELTWPRLDPADRPNPDDLAEQRRAANPHRNRRAKPRPAATPTEERQ